MGFFSKIWKGIKKGFKAVFKPIKKVFTSFGKFMNKLGVAGQIAMMFIPIPGLGALFSGLGKLGSRALGFMTKFGAVGKGAATLLGSAAKFAGAIAKPFINVTKAVKGFFENVTRYVGSKIPGVSGLFDPSKTPTGIFGGTDSAWSRASSAITNSFEGFKGDIASAASMDISDILPMDAGVDAAGNKIMNYKGYDSPISDKNLKKTFGADSDPYGDAALKDIEDLDLDKLKTIKMPTSQIPFGEAFKAARLEGKEAFDWGGKSFHTRTVAEDAAFKTQRPPEYDIPGQGLGGIRPENDYSKPFDPDDYAVGSIEPTTPSLSKAQQNMLRQAQEYTEEAGYVPDKVRELSEQYGDLRSSTGVDTGVDTSGLDVRVPKGPWSRLVEDPIGYGVDTSKEWLKQQVSPTSLLSRALQPDPEVYKPFKGMYIDQVNPNRYSRATSELPLFGQQGGFLNEMSAMGLLGGGYDELSTDSMGYGGSAYNDMYAQTFKQLAPGY